MYYVVYLTTPLRYTVIPLYRDTHTSRWYLSSVYFVGIEYRISFLLHSIASYSCLFCSISPYKIYFPERFSPKSLHISKKVVPLHAFCVQGKPIAIRIVMANIETTERIDALFERISSLIDQARSYVVNAVKIAEVKTRYEVGRYILEDEQQGERAKYGEQVLRQLSARLMERYGEDWTFDTLKRCRQFYQAYANASISATPLLQLENHIETPDSKAVVNSSNAVAPIQLPRFILSWSHYLILMRIENIEARRVSHFSKLAASNCEFFRVFHYKILFLERLLLQNLSMSKIFRTFARQSACRQQTSK